LAKEDAVVIQWDGKLNPNLTRKSSDVKLPIFDKPGEQLT